ncbi:U20-hexatoxin-Hi1a [Parasteatoda tepidariorum]|uniref:U20-hexatoxin-Hi1a n=1 Tax=Parasteatoda tepidariorum TaxID=114398 RepID=UPI001C720606|nr:U24-ctenitoxin-Pn1a [Parasteatoda tepidariorum]XP_042900507.1 U24-ctenitoxin-Pn1a [Parasteatoda tepidariorum]XP_042900508.1 U24-ctenitoxin-Pn1a [Parasteatoda tepidariorum]
MYKLLVLFSMLGLMLAEKPKKTDCEEHREREQKSNAPLPMRLIPECDSKGDYKPLQCFQNSKFCSCWDKTGNPLTQPSGKIKACDCLVKQKEAKPGLLGAFKAQCEEDGKFKKEQCHGSTGHCWCVDPLTGEKKTEPKRGKANC